jgi:hypothetical protein
MNANYDLKVEETLDPQDWVALRQLGHRMFDNIMLAFLVTVWDRAHWQIITRKR